MNLFQDKQTCVHGCNILWPPTWANMIGGGLPWHHPHKKKSIYAKISTATNVWWWPVCCDHSNQVAARRSSRSQNSRPQQGVAWIGPNSCYATAVCRWHCVDDETARVFSASKFRQQDDKLTSQKPEGGTYIAKKKTQMVKKLCHKQSKKKKREFPQCPLGFPTSFGGQLKCRFRTCQLGQKLQGSCFTWWVQPDYT